MNIRNIWKRISVETCMEVVSGWFQTSIELIEVLEIAVAYPESFPLCLALMKASSWRLKWSYIIQKNLSITAGWRVWSAFEKVLRLAGVMPRMRVSSFEKNTGKLQIAAGVDCGHKIMISCAYF